MGELDALLKAASGRSAELDAESADAKQALAELDTLVASKREEKTIAAQNAVRELLKDKEAKMKRVRSLENAAGHVRLALEKLQRAQAVGLKDWKELKEDSLQVSDFAKERLKDGAALADLEAACCGGKLSISGAKLSFVGSAKGFDALKEALVKLESGYSCFVEVEAVMLRVLETRGELKRLEQKHGVSLATAKEGGAVEISGAAQKASQAEKAFRWLLTGNVDLACPRELTGAAKAHAKDVEVETGAFIDISRQGVGFGGGSTIHIRGNSECVHDAEEQVRQWMDEREGAYSVFVQVDMLKSGPADQVKQFTDDLWHFGEKFQIVASASGTAVELRGPAEGKWEAPARAEFKQILEYYEAEAAKAKAACTPAAEEVPDEDAWGAAPEAEFELGHKW